MATKFVTRTIKTTTVTATICTKDTHEVRNENFTLGGTFKDNKQIIKAINAMFVDAPFVILEIVSTCENETLYRCTENEFLSIAKPVPAKEKTNNL